MNAITLTPEGQAVLKRILEYKNEDVLERYMVDKNVSRENADCVFTGFKQFIATCVFMDGRKTASKIIDDMWHTFLLFTRQYRNFCHEYLETFVDHEPISDNESPRFYSRTRQFAGDICGELDDRCWPTKASQNARCVSGSQCGPSLAKYIVG